MFYKRKSYKNVLKNKLNITKQINVFGLYS